MAIDKNNINSKFRSEENLPEEFSWQNMEQGIYEKMNAKKSRRPIGTLLFSTIALAIFIVVGGVYIYVYKENNTSTELKTVVHNANKEEIVSNTKKNNAVNPEVENINDVNTKTESKTVERTFVLSNDISKTEVTIANEIKIKKTFAENKSTKSGNDKTATADGNKVIQNNKIVNSSIKQTAIKNGDFKKEQTALDEKNISDKIKEHELVSENSMEDYKNLIESKIVMASIKNKNFLIISNLYPEMPLIEITNPALNKKEKSEIKNSISISGGILSSATNYGNTSVDIIKSKYEKDALGYSFGLGYNRVISDKFSLNTGIDYSILRIILDYEETTSYAEQRDNLLLSMDINTITGDTIKTYGTGTITGKQTRKVLHYNTHKVISIPLIVLYNIQKSKFRYTVGLGPVLNYNLSANGRTIYAIDDFQTIDKSYFKKMTVGMQAKLGINYSINKRYFIGFNIHYTSPINKWNSSSEFTLSRNLFGSNVSVGYTF